MHTLNAIAQRRAVDLIAEANMLLGATSKDLSNPEAVREAAPQAIALAMGGHPSGPLHPLARALARAGLREIVGMLGSDDFGDAFKTGLGTLVAAAYDRQAVHRKICRTMEVPDFNPFQTSKVDVGLDDAELDAPTREGGEAQHVRVVGGSGETIALAMKTVLARFSPELVKNDAIEANAYIVANFGAIAARREQRVVFGFLTSNPVLSDARSLWNSTDANDLGAAATLSLANVGVGYGKLARQKTLANNELGLVPAYLVVNPEQRVNALSIVKQFHVEGTPVPLEVVAANEIPAASAGWYLFADPAAAPVIGFVTLRGMDGRTVSVRTQVGFRSSAMEAALDHTFGAAVLSRVGTVRGGI